MELTAHLLQTSILLNQPCSLSFGLVDLHSLCGDVEFEEHDVAILHNVLLSFLPVQAGSFYLLLSTMLLQVIVRLHLSHDEAVFEVGVDDTGSSWCQRSISEGPALDLVLTTREVVDELKGTVSDVDDLGDHGGGSEFCGSHVATILIGITSLSEHFSLEFG